MRAFLLAAGVGSRLRPLTDTMPKCMLPVGGTPMIDIWLDKLAKSGVDDVLVNLHHLAEVVSDHLRSRTGPPTTHTVHEPALLGSASTLARNKEWFRGEEVALVCYADNLTDLDLSSFIGEHLSSRAVATVALFRAPEPSACGIVEVDESRRMTAFVEKPDAPASDLANAGIYAFHPSVLEEIPEPPPRDIGYDLLPRLVGRAHTMTIDGYFRDIGTPEAYEAVQLESPQRSWA